MARQVVCRRAAMALVLGLGACSLAAGQSGQGRQDLSVITGRRTALEEQIYQALDERTECDFADTPLTDVVDYFKGRHEIEIQIDGKALQDEAIDSSVPVNRSCRGVRLKSALRTILRDLNLTYVVRDEVLSITTKTEADAMSEVRTYPVRDLVGVATDPDFSSLIELITSTVQPTTWDENGGPGAIQPVYKNTLLVIAQTQQVHEDVAELLSQLRRAAPGPRAVEQASRALQRGRWVDQDRRYIVDPQLVHIVGKLYSSPGETAKRTRD